MKVLLTGVMILAALSGCAFFDQPAHFATEDYPGATPLERLLAQVNLEHNLAPACGGNSRCQLRLPSREELSASNFFDCKAYVMSKAYALQDAGIDESRMRVARFDLMDASHVVLVVDQRYVLDNLDGSVRQLREYARFEPVLASLPRPLMARKLERLPTVSQAGIVN
jgi:hypothetical protein